MPYCPKCVAKLTKRKSDMSYHCKRHGFVRKIIPEYRGASFDRDVSPVGAADQRGRGANCVTLPPDALWKLSRHLDKKFRERPKNWLFTDYWWRLSNIRDRVKIALNRTFMRT